MTASLLVLDVGNSRVKWAHADDRGLHGGGAVAHAGDPTAALAGCVIEPQAVDGVWIADVVAGTQRDALAAWMRDRHGVEPRFASVEARRDGLQCAYAQPQRLGVDRWLMLLAAWHDLRGPACVVGAGTALTFDAVDAGGRHLGGAIAPGLRAMQDAVLGATRFESAGPQEDYADGLGTDTEACVRQGALHASAGLIERLAARYAGGVSRFIAGGDAQVLLPRLRGNWQHRPDLVLEGLRVLALGTDGN